MFYSYPGCVNFWDSKVLRSAAGAHYRVPIMGSEEWENIKKLISSEANVYVADNNIDQFAEDEQGENEDPEEPRTEKKLEDVPDDEEKVTESTKIKRTNFKERMMLDKIYRLQKLREISVIPYYAADYTRNEVVVIIGGETEGLSKESLDLVEERNGIRVNIPLSNDVDSLNSGMALGIVAFEIKRQFLRINKKLEE